MSNPSDIPHIIQKSYHKAEKLLLSHGITNIHIKSDVHVEKKAPVASHPVM
jgi:hypothetical protein